MAIERIIGVDFGTSTSVIRVKRYENGKPVGSGARLDTQKVFDLVPTVIQEMNGHRYYGEEALTPKGRNAIIYRGFKVDLESTDEEKREQARKLTEEFMAYLAAAYKTDSEGGHLGDSTDKERTIISYPVKWSDATKAFMLEAARKAGFPNVEGMDEAQAAINAVVVQNQEMLLSKKYLQEDLPATILLIDMGAGTTDLVLCRYTPGKQPKNEILATWPKDGNILFGGQEVDELLRNWATELFEDKTQAEFVLKRIPLEQFKAWKETEVAKLLANNETVEQFYTLDDLADMAGVALKPYNLDRVALESWAESYLKQFPELVNGCLQSAEITGEQVDLVVLTGGHSQWYFAKEIVAGKMPQISPVILPQIAQNCSRIVQVAHPQETAALGMVFSPLSVHFEKEEQSKTAAGSNQADTKTNIVDFYRKHAKELLCSGWVVCPDGRCTNIHRTGKVREASGIKKLFYHANGYVFGITKDGNIDNIAARALDMNTHNQYKQMMIDKWTDVVDVASSSEHTVGLLRNGTVVAVGRDHKGQCNVGHWSNVVQICCKHDQTAGLKSDGTVVTTYGDKDIEKWKDIVSICYPGYGSELYALRKDGTILNNAEIYQDTYSGIAKHVKAIVPCDVGVFALLDDGTVWKPKTVFSVAWRNVVSIAAGSNFVAGLRSDGTVVAEGKNDYGQCNVDTWRDVIAISTHPNSLTLYALRKDGKVYYTSHKKEQRLFGEKVIPDPQGTLTSYSIFDIRDSAKSGSDVITWDDLTQGTTFDMSDIDL